MKQFNLKATVDVLGALCHSAESKRGQRFNLNAVANNLESNIDMELERY